MMQVDLDNPTPLAKKAIISKAMSLLGSLGGKKGGKSKSPAKQSASRENGKLGGRPPKGQSASTETT